MRNRVTSLSVGLLVLLTSASAIADSKGALRLEYCVVSLLAEAQVPARKAGVIQTYDVIEGSVVKAGDSLARIDDAEARVQVAVAQGQLEAAQQRAENDIDVRYAKAAAEVAKAEVLAAEDANTRVPGTVPISELRRLRLEQNRATLGIEQAEAQFALAALESEVAASRVDAAQLEIDTRRVTSPIDGIVVRLHHRRGEWIEAGRPICHVVGLDKMRVTGFVNVKEHQQSAVAGRPVTVLLPGADDKPEEFHGTIGFASPVVQPGGEYRVWVEVENRRIGDFWKLRPGILVEMSIDLAN